MADTTDDTTTTILAQHAAILDNLATGQAAIALGLQAMADVIGKQQAEGSKTSEALAALNTVIVAVQRKNEARWEESKKRAEAAAVAFAEARGGGQPR